MNNFEQILRESGLPTQETEIRQQFERITAEENLITNTSRMSPFWRLVTAIAVQPVKWLTDELINNILPNLFLRTAQGAWLQMMAWSVGLDFKQATKAEGVITFTKQSDLTPITIKAGTVVQTERINDTIFKLIVTADTVIEKGKLSAKVPVIAEQAGTSYNLAAGYYRVLAEQINGIVSVENEENWLITPGADKETDEELRMRCRNQFAASGKHHIDSVYKAMASEIAGISVDRIYFKHDAPRGPGTANMYLLLDTGVASQPFIDKVNQHVREDGWHGHGDDLICYAMPETQYDLICKVYFYTDINLTTTRKAEILQQVENIIRCAFRENNNFNVTRVYPYKRFSWSLLGEEIHQLYPEIGSLIWGQQDIESDLSVPRIRSLTISEEREAISEY
ncbi:baseplate J/gp47 family protein [Gallibacterium sp. AGMB14963]|uniref:baseplate J/gp47 family protein n=1 Tax=Gallibacterium faecale TaxID=3019086 RepID=UPI0022F1DCC5|nr:baseplate J/gp47 family protein [Gallibacterium sp. AGMB14963]MDA3979046.1 baseplate J/gp47 family protein [Gallibacterium sp. AGMB14963]